MRARCAKISMMSPTRSSTGTLHAASKLRSCIPLSVASTMTLRTQTAPSDVSTQVFTAIEPSLPGQW